jgi:modulator of FtsH protease HflK
MFNLNDGRWGRGEDSSGGDQRPSGNRPDSEPPSAPPPPPPPPPSQPNRPRGQGPNQGPPDLDELWRDFNRKLGGLFGGGRGGDNSNRPTGGGNGGSGGGGFKPDMKNAGFGLGLVAAVAVLIWLGTGFFIVNEGQQAVITQFGSYKTTVGAGFNWRLPYPIQRHEIVVVTQIRSTDVGGDSIVRSTGLRESAMLTEDENIVEIKFAVQYRLSDARQYLFESKSPSETVVQVAETAVREVVGKMKMDKALADERDQIAPRVRALMQTILDRYKIGVEIVGINLQQGGVRPPEQVQAAFDDVLKAGQELERIKNEAQAYANDVIPKATGTASRLKEESDAYKARIVAQAQGDAGRFGQVLAEYQKAPQVTRDRMYIDAMQQIYANTTKVLVDSKQGSNLLYLPLDKLTQLSVQNAANAAAPSDAPSPNVAGTAPPQSSVIPVAPAGNGDSRAREGRSRDRDAR